MTALQIGLLIFSWLLVGFLSVCIYYIIKMRGESLDYCLLSTEGIGLSMFFGALFGCATPLIILAFNTDYEAIGDSITKFLWSLANPGKEEKDDTGDSKSTDTDNT